MRWEHPERGLLPPAQFIPLAEATGLILPLGWWVLEEACRQAALWQRRYLHEPPLCIGVNLSSRQLEHPALVSRVAQAMEESGIAPGSLKLEITESVMMADPATVIPRLEALRALGVRLAVDDFGTGYSSMAYLSTLPLDTLKIDRSFVSRLNQRVEDRAIVRAIIDMARALGLDVTSEGVETVEQLQQLREMTCDRVQGFYFSRPLCEAAVTVLIAQGLPTHDLSQVPA